MTEQQRHPVPTPEQAEALMNDPNLTWEDLPEDQAPPVAEDETVRLASTESMPAESETTPAPEQTAQQHRRGDGTPV